MNVWNSISLLFTGYCIGIGIAAVLVVLGVWTRFGSDLLTTLTAMLNPLPAIALLPLAMIWFGLGPAGDHLYLTALDYLAGRAEHPRDSRA